MRVHVLALSIKESGGGSHKNCIAIIRALRQAGHEVVAHTLISREGAPSDIVPRFHDAGGLRFLAFNRFLAALLTELEPEADRFFLYGPYLSFGAGRYRREGRVPCAVYLDNYLESMGVASSRSSIMHRISRTLYDRTIGILDVRRVDRYLAVSPYVREAFARAAFPAARLVVVPNFFDLPDATPREPHRPFRFLYVGRLSRDKGIDTLLRTLAKLSAGKLWDVHIVGEGERDQEFRELANELGLAERVTFVPWSDERKLESEYAAADVLVHPARWPEPFGRTIVEAMARAIPVIVPEQGGSAWAAGEAGLVFHNGKQASLFKAMSVLLSDTEVWKRLSAAGPVRAQAFSRAAVVPKLIQSLQVQGDLSARAAFIEEVRERSGKESE